VEGEAAHPPPSRHRPPAPPPRPLRPPPPYPLYLCPPAEPTFRLANELGPLLVVALGAVLAPLSSSLLPWELSLSPSDACISTCKA
jgi:hypothetical protein